MPQLEATQLDELLGRFQLKTFRPGQEEVVRTVLAGQDCLCVMPTGGGKSLCFQLPSLARAGLTLVVSPLIALMKDQVDSLIQLGIRATYINSTLDAGQQRQRLQQMAQDQFDLVYIAPERLRSPRFLDVVAQVHVQLLAVDEAHCISQWGHDFRPDYARLGKFRHHLGDPQTIALTATATPTVRQDIAQRLNLREPQVYVTGFARPNLAFRVVSASGDRDKQRRLMEFLGDNPGSGIIYAATRKACHALYDALSPEIERRVGIYHAGLTLDDRRAAQEAFMRGELSIIIATNAFGMGIDKPDLRFVVHYNMPGSLEAYYQEAGRAGRDGLDSRCLLLFDYSDRFIQEFFIDNAYPSPATVAAIYSYLCNLDEDPIEVTQQELRERLDLPTGSEGVGASEQLLEQCGALERLSSSENQASVRLESELPTLVDLIPKEAKVRRKVLRALENIVGDRRYERVYFPLARLTAMADASRESVLRALRDLDRLDAIDYVPPFRGRAIHILHPDRPFDQLGIDFAELQRRKQAELEKLNRVVRFAQSRRCRQREIMDYFGDTSNTQCGCCDNCKCPQPSPERAVAQVSHPGDEAVRQAIRVVLSGVARARENIGKTLLARMLCGSESAQVTKLRLDRLSTFGLLSHLKQTETVALIDAVVEVHLLEQVENTRFRPVLCLTDDGRELMRGGSYVPDNIQIPQTLRNKLNKFHRNLSDGAAEKAKPSSDHGGELAVASESDRTDPAMTAPAAGSDEAAHWTWQLVLAGFSLADCARIRRLDPSQIRQHLVESLQDEQVLSADTQLNDQQWDALGQVLAKLAERVGQQSHDHAQLVQRLRDCL